MKKKQLKASLQLVKKTLRLAMDALKQAHNELNACKLMSEKFKCGGYVSNMANNKIMDILKNSRERMIDSMEKEAKDSDSKTKPQAGDKIVDGNNNDSWFTKNDDGSYTIKLNPNTKIFEWIAKEDDSKVTGWNEPNQNESEYPDYVCMKDFNRYIIKGTILKYGFVNKYLGKCYQSTTNKQICYAPELFKDNKEYFEVYQPKKETPLADLNKEVQEELEKRNDLSCKSTDSTNCESYVIQANEAVDKFMPLVNGWEKCQPFAEGSKIFEHEGNGHIDQSFWKWNIVNYRKAAIKVAIAHFELIQKQGGWLTHFDCVQIINELQKMLSE